MTHNSTSNAHSSRFRPYSDKDMILSEDEEESATLAEPMTLEGAKQLAQSSGRVDNAAPTPPVSHTLPVASPSPHSHLASPSPSSLHHLTSPPIPPHHSNHSSRTSIHPLASPPHHTGTSSIHSHIASPSHHSLTSPSHPHLAPLHHHDHPLWVPPSVSQEDEDAHEGHDLPSTIDIQAIRDSPSPDPTSDKLVTINENWATLEEQGEDQDGDVAAEDEEEEDEETEDEDDSNSSESDSSLSDSVSPKEASNAESSKRSLIKGNDLESTEPFFSDHSGTRSHSASQSDESCDSNSESDSQDSDSDTSDHSSTGGSESSSFEDEEEEDDSTMSKPLPRMKPQLTASTPHISKKLSNFNQRENSSLIAKGKLLNEKLSYSKQLEMNSHKIDTEFNFKMAKNTISSNLNLSPMGTDSKYQKNGVNSITTNVPTQRIFSSPENVCFKSEEESNLSESGDETPSNDKDISKPDSQEEDFNHKNSIEDTKQSISEPVERIISKERNLIDSENDSNLQTAMEGLKFENCGSLDNKLEHNESSNDIERFSEGKYASSNGSHRAEMEERRLAKERQMNQEFDRLLKSTKLKTDIQESKDFVVSKSEKLVFPNNSKNSLTKTMSPSKKNRCILGEGQSKVSCSEVSINTVENRDCLNIQGKLATQLLPKDFEKDQFLPFRLNKMQKSDSFYNKKETSSINNKSCVKSEFEDQKNLSQKGQTKNCLKSDTKKKAESKLLYYSSDSKSNYPSCSSSMSSSSSSSDSEEDASNINLQTPKRVPSLNVTAKYISELDHKTNTFQKREHLKNKSNNKDLLKSSSSHMKKSKSSLDRKRSNVTSEIFFANIRPTIADLVKVRERRSSFEKESLSESEKDQKDKRGIQRHSPSDSFKGLNRENEEETTSSSEASEDLNEKVDLDTELTQTFSVSENNFNQGRLTMKIAAMKMAKFGKTGLREVTNCGLPTRSDLHSSPLVNISSAFKRPRLLSQCKGNSAFLTHSGASSFTSSRNEPHKVKTAAERKTYVDALPPCGSYCSLKSNKKRKGSSKESEMRVPATSLSHSGGSLCTSTHGSEGFAFSSATGSFHNGHHYHQNHYLHGEAHTDEDEEQISRLAHHLSQISHDHISDGLQVLDQEDLAAILPDVTNTGPPETPSPTVPLDPFPEDVELDRHRKSDSENESEEETKTKETDLPDLCVRDAINSISLLAENSSLHVNNSFSEGLNECVYHGNSSSASIISHSKYKQSKSKKSESLKDSEEQFVDRKRDLKAKPYCYSHKDNSLDEDPDTPTMPELESYAALDCNASNVSPDSGIQSVNGSPLHHVGSPHHHSPYYSSGVLSVSNGNPGPSNSSNESLHGRNSTDSGSNNTLRSASPSLSLQDSPPPPTLLPAVTPPHMASSPRYNYDSPNSPPMPSLKCQVDLPPWEEKNPNSNLSSLEEQGTLNEKGPGRPKEEISEKIETLAKPKRPRGRPKGSKNKKKLEENLFFQIKEKPRSFIKEPLAKLDKINEVHHGISGLDYSAMKHKWRGATADPDDFPSRGNLSAPRRRKPGRPKRIPVALEPELGGSLMMAYGLNTLDKKPAKNSISESLELKVKRPVGRPRKHSKPPVDCKQPLTLASKKCFSEKIMHKIINENVRNSEKSDKLSVRHLDDQDLSENGRSSEKSDKLTHHSLSKKSFNYEKLTANAPLLSKENSPKIFPVAADSSKSNSFEAKDISDPYLFQDSTTSGIEDFKSDLVSLKGKRKKRLKSSSDGIPLDEKKRKRGRKKELPAIFEKVYGSVKNINLKSEQIKVSTGSVPLLKTKKKKKKHKKPFKSKHKNIVDPVFLAQLEELIAEVQKCSISKGPILPQPKPGEVLLPSIFKIRKVTFTSKKRRGAEKPKSSDKESGTEGEGTKEKLPSKRKKKLQEMPKQGKERSEANEQRLPLKKRHRHISTAVPTSPDPPKFENSKSDIVTMKVATEKADGKDKFSIKSSESYKIIKNESKATKSPNDSQNEINETSVIEQKDSTSHESMSIDNCSREVGKIQPYGEESPEILPDKNMEEFEKKQESYHPSLVTTTPKKRHRLEVDLASTTVIAPTLVSTASLTTTVTTNVINSVSSTLIPKSSSKALFISSKIKLEKDIKSYDKEISLKKAEKIAKISDKEISTKKQEKEVSERKHEKSTKLTEEESLHRKQKELKVNEEISSKRKERESNLLEKEKDGKQLEKEIVSKRRDKISKLDKSSNKRESKYPNKEIHQSRLEKDATKTEKESIGLERKPPIRKEKFLKDFEDGAASNDINSRKQEKNAKLEKDNASRKQKREIESQKEEITRKLEKDSKLGRDATVKKQEKYVKTGKDTATKRAEKHKSEDKFSRKYRETKLEDSTKCKQERVAKLEKELKQGKEAQIDKASKKLEKELKIDKILTTKKQEGDVKSVKEEMVKKLGKVSKIDKNIDSRKQEKEIPTDNFEKVVNIANVMITNKQDHADEKKSISNKNDQENTTKDSNFIPNNLLNQKLDGELKLITREYSFIKNLDHEKETMKSNCQNEKENFITDNTEQLGESIKQTDPKRDESKCIVVIEKCDTSGLSEANKKMLSTGTYLNDDKGIDSETVCKPLEKEETHSDSDIPSEHEPLCESDQSGFMSDKEGPKEIPKKVAQKRRKKKRDLRSPMLVGSSKPDHSNLCKGENAVIKKKVKRRKTNKTGFPTIRKKKKRKIEISESDITEVTLSMTKVPVIPKEEPQGFSSASQDGSLKEGTSIVSSNFQDKICSEPPAELPKQRGRPKKIKDPESANSLASENKIESKLNQPFSKDLREILRERKTPKPCDNNPECKDSALDDDCLNLKRILEKVANGRSRRKRDLSEESSKIFMDRRKSRRIGEDEHVEDSDSNLISSEYQISSEPVSSDESSRYHKGKRKVPRWKKRYLGAGLLSDYYKQDEPPRKNGEITLTRCRFNYEPENHIYGLLPPPSYCKKWLRERQVDFLLPYDLWWLHTHNMLPGRDLVPSWNFKRIKSNIYYDVRPPNHDSEIQACNCRRPTKPGEKGCLEDCINRMMFIECSAHTCPIKEFCSNQRIQRHETLSNLQRFMTADKGWGIKSKIEIKQGTFILEYVGEVVSEKEFKYRMQTKYSNDTHHYCLNLDRGMVIDGHRMGGDCRFVNHSCNPNCEMQKWYVNGQYRMGLFALEGIKADQELSYDYNFSLFNPTEGQSCKCGAENCRGVIGGRSQRLNGHQSCDEKRKTSGRNKKDICKKRKRGASTDTEGSCVSKSQYPVKPLSHQQRLFILAHRCFLLRNLERIKRNRDRSGRVSEKKLEEIPEATDEPCNKIQKFLTHFTALNTARSVKTRRLAQAEDDPEMTRVAKLAQIFKDIYDKLVASRDEKEKPLATPFMALPSKKKYPNYYTRIGEPIDLALIEKNILTGHYVTAEVFDRDIMRLFANNLRFFGRNTEVGQMAVGLRKVYSECKLQFKPLLEEVLGEDQLPQAFANCSLNEEFEDEDVIRCVCNLHRDEGMMIQCEQCLVWQHCDCMGVAEDSPDQYLCEECSPRLVSPEVPMTPQPSDSPKDKYFITLLRDNLQIKLGDSVYILRDRPTQKSGERRQPAYKLAKDVKQHELLIFKVENLWIDQKGDKFAFGHHYLMPHETFHEPWRKFFPNEVIRSPICDIIPLDMIVNHCWVMDLNSYCRGRPIGAVEEHVYVCEYRVDKSARVFSKISKPKYPICTKPYAFITFSQKLRPQRTYTPHEVITNNRSRATTRTPTTTTTDPSPTQSIKVEIVSTNNAPANAPSPVPLEVTSGNGSSAPNSRASSDNRKSRSCSANKNSDGDNPELATPVIAEVNLPSTAAKVSTHQTTTERTKKRIHINRIATRLLKQLPSKGAIDLAYLLETGKRMRKKTSAFSS